ncbi:MAG: PAS domain-containing protein [Alphaproteobacteria bacterium]|nr:PAS domain-containing protein [Alphaproteobacteria bacterium]
MFEILIERELPRPVGADDPMARLWKYWHEKRAGRVALPRDDFDVSAFPDLFGRINIVTVSPGRPTRFRFRLFGSGMDDPIANDMTDRQVTDVREPAYADLVQRNYLQAYRLRRPCFWEIKVDIGGDNDLFHYCRLVLPMTSKPGGFDMLLVASARYADDYHEKTSVGLDLLGQRRAHRYDGDTPDAVHQWEVPPQRTY